MLPSGNDLKRSLPGCDIEGYRSFGLFSFLRFLCLPFACGMAGVVTANQSNTAHQAVTTYVGSIVTESFGQGKVADANARQKPVATPAGSVELIVSHASDGQKDQVDMRIRFRQPGRVTIRLPKSWADPQSSNLRVFDVRPWPIRAMVPKNSVRAGAGPLAARLDLANVSPVQGDAVSIRLRLTGAAAMAVDVAPDVSIVRTDLVDQQMVVERAMAVDGEVDWGDSGGQAMSRSWSYIWRSRSPGAFRIQPIRLTYLDDKGVAQTLLVTAPGIEVRPRPLFRAKDILTDRQLPVRGGSWGGLGQIRWLAVLSTTLAGCLAIYLRIRRRSTVMAWSLRRKLRKARTPEAALAAWRSIEPAWRACRENASPEAVESYERLSQRAFGRTEAETQRF